MGVYNMLNGDAPVFERIADAYTINENYHPPVMGGTLVQHIMLGTPTPSSGIRSRELPNRRQPASPIPTRSQMCGASQLPDVTINADGSLAPIQETMLLAGVI
jgi:hypothetical protein